MFLVRVEDFNVSVRLAEIVTPQAFSSDHRHIQPGHAGFTRATVGVDHAVSVALTCTVPTLTANLTVGRAAERLGTRADVVADGISQVGL